MQDFIDPFQVEMDDKFHVLLQYQLTKSQNAELSGTAAKKAFVADRLRKNEQFFQPKD